MRTHWSPFLVGVLVAACAGGAPTVVPASAPTLSSSPALPTPVAEPTVHGTVEASLEPSAAPPVEPSHRPTAEPTRKPTARPTQGSAPTATTGATAEPTTRPSECPTAAVLTPVEFVNADAACFGSEDVRLLAWLGGLPSMGWEAPYIEPAWLAYPPNVRLSALWQRGPGGDEMCGAEEDCAYVIIHVRPDTTIVLGSAARWVTATGHLADPMADLCRYEPWGGTSPPDSEAQAECRRSFVLTSLRDAEPPSP